ncbi:hypothetical protein KGM48_02375 [Patescibacteria group bacterium]|nr:hypothetical protein [Patescibacteria group bacterium]
MRARVVPSEVQEARKKGDKKKLAALGRAGGRASAEARAISKILDAERRERLLEEVRKVGEGIYSVSPDGDVLPPS